MHVLQKKILEILEKNNGAISGLTLRGIGDLIGDVSPQKIKHHITQLQDKQLVTFDKKTKTLTKVRNKDGDIFINIPILGAANCGVAKIFADECVEGFLRVSKKILKSADGLFAVQASGVSMNKAKIGGGIDDGDYVIVDTKRRDAVQTGDYVLSVIDGLANVKRIFFEGDRIVLRSESTQEYPPISIHADDNISYIVSGKVVDVIKK